GLIFRGAMVSNSSSVFAEPCAEHALAFMLAQARQLPQSLDDQRGSRGWPSLPLRANCRLLQEQSVLLLGYGAIARRLAELVAPFRMDVRILRRKKSGTEVGTVITPDELERTLGEVDHVMNILPDNPETKRFIDERKFAAMKPGAVFYNIGRGTTVEQEALLAALQSGQIGVAYLDVTDPEPLPPEHPLWTAPNCFITPHTAGGFDREPEALVKHFLANLERFVAGGDLRDRVI
ncbi:MAG: NAD(P)-dependent oxidoreductase, partial [Chthoniobacteraceae bacterium]